MFEDLKEALGRIETAINGAQMLKNTGPTVVFDHRRASNT